jgi:hypothetical protein
LVSQQKYAGEIIKRKFEKIKKKIMNQMLSQMSQIIKNAMQQNKTREQQQEQ